MCKALIRRTYYVDPPLSRLPGTCYSYLETVDLKLLVFKHFVELN